MAAEKPYTLKVWQTFPKVKDFDRNEKGDVIWSSLKGPDQIEGHAQYVRERLIATEETKILRFVCRHSAGALSSSILRFSVEKKFVFFV